MSSTQRVCARSHWRSPAARSMLFTVPSPRSTNAGTAARTTGSVGANTPAPRTPVSVVAAFPPLQMPLRPQSYLKAPESKRDWKWKWKWEKWKWKWRRVQGRTSTLHSARPTRRDTRGASHGRRGTLFRPRSPRSRRGPPSPPRVVTASPTAACLPGGVGRGVPAVVYLSHLPQDVLRVREGLLREAYGVLLHHVAQDAVAQKRVRRCS
ncbi:hypothetical protein C8R44DRAFT_818937 [Mycena epipterygia]|nr:hypothetical protein C8R44DRAFT_818937 [Mycena epipterygia]